MNYFDLYPTIIFIDATIDDQDAGTVSVIRPKFAADFPTALSVHDVGLKDMIEAIYIKDVVPDLHLVTISIEKIIPMDISLSKKVEESVPIAIKTVLKLAEKYKK